MKKKSWEKKKPCNAGHKTGSLRSHQRKKDIFSILVDTCNGKLVASQLDNHAPVRNTIVTLCPKSPWFIPEIKEQKAKCRPLEICWRETRLTADREIYMQRCAVVQGFICMFLKFVFFLYILVLSIGRNFVTLLHTIFEFWWTCYFWCEERVFWRFI